MKYKFGFVLPYTIKYRKPLFIFTNVQRKVIPGIINNASFRSRTVNIFFGYI